MTVATMRRIDRFVGIPCCWLTGIWLTMSRHLRTQPHSDHIHTALTIKFFGLGSILLSTSFLSQLHGHGCKIILLTFDVNRELAERLPQLSHVLTISTHSPFHFVLDTLSALRFIRSAKPDAVFDLEFFSKYSTLFSSLSGARLRIGFALPALWRGMSVTHQVPLIHSMHARDLFLEQLKPVGMFPSQPAQITSLQSTPIEWETMNQKLGLGTSSATIVAMNINAGTTSLERRWPPDRFIEVAGAIKRKRPDTRFFLVGNGGERGYVQAAIEAAPVELQNSMMNCAGLLSMGELIALFERSGLLVTNDSGPMHIASSVGTPVVALFGPESPSFYGPTGNERVVYKAIPCSPCLNVYDAKVFECPYSARCMREISVGEVLTEVDRLLPQVQPHAMLG